MQLFKHMYEENVTSKVEKGHLEISMCASKLLIIN